MKLRTGRRNHRNLYLQRGGQPDETDPCLGLIMHPAVAAAIVDAVNQYGPERLAAALPNCMPEPPITGRDMSLPQTCRNADGEVCQPAECMLAEPHYATRPEVP